MGKGIKGILLGFGSGLIILGLVFYCLYGIKLKTLQATLAEPITETEVIARARELGMVFTYEIDEQKMPESRQSPPPESEPAADAAGASPEAEPVVLPESSPEAEPSPQPIETEEDAPVADAAPSPAQADTEPPPAPEPPPDASPHAEQVTVSIPKGANAKEIAETLFLKGVVEDPFAFTNYIISKGEARRLKDGTISMPKDLTNEEALSYISSIQAESSEEE